MQKIPFLFLIGMSMSMIVQGQTHITDTAFARAATQERIKLYTETIGGQAQLYNGSQYREPYRTGDSHPFFESEDWLTGYVIYDSERYNDVPLLFDIMLENLVTEHPYSGDQIALINERLTEFSLGSHIFVKLKGKDYKNSLPRDGFYEILYKGPTTFIGLHQKNRREAIESHEINIYFDTRDRYFILKDGVFFPVRNKKSVLNLLKDEKIGLRQFAKKNKLNFRIHREESLAKLAAQYDAIKKNK